MSVSQNWVSGVSVEREKKKKRKDGRKKKRKQKNGVWRRVGLGCDCDDDREREKEGEMAQLQGNGCLPGSLIRGRHCLLSLSSLGIICLNLGTLLALACFSSTLFCLAFV
jgi:hypothetical protein